MLLVAGLAVTEGAAGAATPTAVDYSFNVAPGDYEVTVNLGSASQAAQTGVQVEARRTMLAPVSTRAGEFRREVLAVNVRSPESMPTGEEGTGKPGLQVHLTGSRPAASNVSVTPVRRPRLFVISDSTASDWLNGPKRGWAQKLPQLLKPGTVVANYADSGESTVSWLSNPRLFATVQPLIRAGDQVLIQLAHNDKTTPESTFRANLGKLVDGVRQRGGLPVLVTPPVRHLFGANGKLTPTGLVVNTLGVDLPAVIRDVAGKLGTPLVDLTARSRALLEKLGESASWPIYLTTQHDGVQDSTHFSEHGGTVMAGLVTQGMADAHLPAAAFLRTGAAPACAARPARPAAAAASTVKVWLAGDSTMADPRSSCPVGWGNRFDALFTDQVSVVNKAVSGRSIQTWLYESNVTGTKNSAGECVVSPNAFAQRWRDMLDPVNGMHAGDYLFIQFGINDGDANCPRHVGSARYQSLLTMMADAAKSRGAHPVLLTPVAAITCSGSTAVGNRGFLTPTTAAGTATGAPVIDLHKLSYTLYNALKLCPNDGDYSKGAVGAFFCNDHTHFEAAGADRIARVVAKALRDQKIGLAGYLK
ncbi:Lysophospholipase L1 [Amycolatopsis tolypomycina]|uniref:Lysophospholipase L1 n=1 Tax=Amycolatopsis tolypomycina TaxID=208445 RepID=A0A1H4Y5B1_9PSEU|nr:Lysophospholipase L1 [Amycolatopsis tolypomycina]